MENGPLIHKFSTGEGKYIYDTATSHILHVDDITYEIIDDFGRLSRDEIVSKYSSQYSEEQIVKLVDDLESVSRAQGCFPSQRPEIGLTFDMEHYKHQLSNLCPSVTLEVTNRCNMRCEYCVFSGNYEGARLHGTRDMDWETARKSIDYMFAHCSEVGELLNIGFYGGEPLLNFKLIRQSIEYAKANVPEKKRLMFSMTSNMTKMTPEIAKYIVRNDISLLASLDGPKHIHDRCRVSANGKGTYDEVMAALKMIRKCSEEYYRTMRFRATLSLPVNLLEIDRFFMDSFPDTSDVSVSGVRESNKEYLSQFSGEDFEITGEKELEDLIHDALANGKLFANASKDPFLKKKSKIAFGRYGIPLSRMHHRPIHFGFPQGKMTHSGPCTIGTRKMFVAVDGSIYPCDQAPQGSELFCVGNINNGGYDVEKAHKLMSQFFELTSSECSNCWAIRLCGLCMIRVAENGSLSKDKKLAFCANIKRNKSIRLKLYCSIKEKCEDAFEDGGLITFS